MSDKFVGTYAGYEIFVSNAQYKKYYAVVDGRRVNFGDKRYEHYHDKMGHYARLDHWDKERRRAYKTRHEKDRHTRGTAGWFADKILW